MTDRERLNWIDKQAGGNRILVSRSRVTGRLRIQVIAGGNKGGASVRSAIETFVARERRKELGLKR